MEVDLQEMPAATIRLAHRKCVPGGDGLRHQCMEGVPDEVRDRLRRCLPAFVGDISSSPQPEARVVSRVSLLLKAMPTLVAARKAVEWREGLVLAAVVVEHAFPSTPPC